MNKTYSNYLKSLILLAFLILNTNLIFGQAPNISYPEMVRLKIGNVIVPIKPNNSGGAVPANTYGQVSTLAGGGQLVPYNGAALAASFANPNAVAIDVNGNVYISVSKENLIRKIDPSGNVSTFAGSGNAAFADGLGTAPSFWDPCGVATDAQGNVYVADSGNEKIRKISPLGVVTTLAGSGNQGTVNGIGRAASFKNPTNIATDSAGNVYVTDAGNYRIRKISPVGLVTTLAGSGISGSADGTGDKIRFTILSYPAGVTTDNEGNVFIADQHDNRIRKIKPTGEATIFAGTGYAGKLDGLGTRASFNSPSGVVADAAGNVYVADQYNNLIRKIRSNGLVTTLAGSGKQDYADGKGMAASFNNPTGLAIDAEGNLYVADMGNNRIRKITRIGVVTTLAGSNRLGLIDNTGIAASFSYPSDVATDLSGNLYVADLNNNLIRKVTRDGVVTTIAGSGTQGYKDGKGMAASFYNPTGIATDATGNIYVADEINNIIRKVSPTGVVTTFAGSGNEAYADGNGKAASFNHPSRVAIDAAGNVYVTDAGNYRIRKISPAGVVTTLAGSGSLGNSNGTGTAASFGDLCGVATDARGNVFVADQRNQRICKISPSGVVTTLAGGSWGQADGKDTLASFNSPSGIAIDATGNVYVADTYNNRIRKITQTGVVTTLAGSDSTGHLNGNGLAASFWEPSGVTTDAEGSLYVTDKGNNLIRKISITGYTISSNLPDGLSFDATTGTIYGTPKVPIPVTTYVITAYNLNGSSATKISLMTENLNK